MTDVEVVKKIIEQEGWCSGIACSICPFNGSKYPCNNHEEILSTARAWLKEHEAATEPAFRPGVRVRFDYQSLEGEGVIVGRTPSGSWSVLVGKVVRGNPQRLHGDRSGAEPDGGSHYWNVKPENMEVISDVGFKECMMDFAHVRLLVASPIPTPATRRAIRARLLSR